MNLAIVGGGDWGERWFKTISEKSEFQYVGVWDTDERVREGWKERGLVFNNFESLVSHANLDGVIISTPLEYHHQISKSALNNDLHVLVEKPFGESDRFKVEELYKLAISKKRCLMVDYTFIYSEPFELLKKNCSDSWNEYFSHRLSPAKYFGGSGLIDDLLAHDLSMIFSLKDLSEINVRCDLQGLEGDGGYSLARVQLKDGPLQAQIIAGSQWPEKRRDVVLKDRNRSYFFNDLDEENPVKVYERSGKRLELKGSFKRNQKSALEYVLEEFGKRVTMRDFDSDFELVKKVNLVRDAIKKSHSLGGEWVSAELEGA